MLDVGCGTGIATEHFNAPFRIGIDPSIELLKIAARKSDKAHYIQACGEALPFRDDAFDFVVSLTAIHNFDDPLTGIDEMKRVCRPGGRAAITVLKKSRRFEEIRAWILEGLEDVVEEDEERDRVFVGLCHH